MQAETTKMSVGYGEVGQFGTVDEFLEHQNQAITLLKRELKDFEQRKEHTIGYLASCKRQVSKLENDVDLMEKSIIQINDAIRRLEIFDR